MVTMQSGHITSAQQELSVIFINIFSSNLSQGQPQEIMAASDGLHGSYLSVLNISISDHFKLYNKAIVGIPESHRYDPTRYK